MRKIKPTEPTIGNLESQQQAKFDGYFGISILHALVCLDPKYNTNIIIFGVVEYGKLFSVGGYQTGWKFCACIV